ncbi:MAG: hypothetical protein V4844_22240 [Pseudomonadota bacterium]
MTRTFNIWLTARRLANAESTYVRLRGDLPYTRETWQQAEERLEEGRRRVEALRRRLSELTGTPVATNRMTAPGR